MSKYMTFLQYHTNFWMTMNHSLGVYYVLHDIKFSKNKPWRKYEEMVSMPHPFGFIQIKLPMCQNGYYHKWKYIFFNSKITSYLN